MILCNNLQKHCHKHKFANDWLGKIICKVFKRYSEQQFVKKKLLGATIFIFTNSQKDLQRRQMRNSHRLLSSVGGFRYNGLFRKKRKVRIPKCPEWHK